MTRLTTKEQSGKKKGLLFVSYAHKDRTRARWIISQLRRSGYDVRYDEDFKPGESFRREIRSNIEKSQKVLVLWSEHSVGSSWVITEAAWGDGLLFPLRLDENIALPDVFLHDHCETLTTWQDGVADPEQFSRVLEKISREVPLPERIPPAPVHFVGRKPEINELLAHLTAQQPRSVIVKGQPGVGKTGFCLAGLEAESISEKYGRNVHYVDLREAESYNDLIQEIARSLDFESSIDPAGHIARHMSELPTLLVLDNCQKCMLDGNTWNPDVLSFLRSIDGIGESTFVGILLGAEHPGDKLNSKPIDIKGLELDDRKRLFKKVAGAKFSSLDQWELDKILKKTDGLPMAIRPLAARAQTAERGELKRYLGRGDTLEKSFNLALMDPRIGTEGIRLLSILSTLPRALTLESVNDFGFFFDEFDASEAVHQLRQLRLIERGPGSESIRLCDPVRAYISDHHRISRKDRLRLIGYAITLAMFGNFMERGEFNRMRRKLAEEFYNTEALLSDGVEMMLSKQSKTARQVSGLLQSVEKANAILDKDERDAFRKLISTGRDPLTASVIELGRYQRFAGVGETTLLERVVEIVERQGDLLEQAEALRVLGFIKRARSDLKQAEIHFLGAKAVYDKMELVEDRMLGWAHCARNLGETKRLHGQVREARDEFKSACRCYRKVEFSTTSAGPRRTGYGGTLTREEEIRKGIAVCIAGLGMLAMSEGRNTRAARWFAYAQASANDQEAKDNLMLAACQKGFGDLAADAEPEQAREHYENALAMFRGVGFTQMVADCIYSLGDLSFKLKRFAEARNYYQDAHARYDRCNCLHGLENCRASLADLDLAHWDHAQSGEMADQNLAHLQEIYTHAEGFFACDDTVGKANALQGLADVERLRLSFEVEQRYRGEARALLEANPQAAIKPVGAMSERWRHSRVSMS